MEELTPAQRAANGAKVFDALKPAWPVYIDEQDFSIVDPGRCACTQVFGGYGDVIDEIEAKAKELGLPADSYDLGLCCYRDEDVELTDAWRAEINRRIPILAGV